MIPEDRERIIRENLNLLAGAIGDLDGICPGWAGIFEQFLSRVYKFNRGAGKNYELRILKIRGLAVHLEWNVDGEIALGIQQVTRRFKSDVVNTCMICGEKASFRAPVAGYAFCRGCMELQMAIQPD